MRKLKKMNLDALAKTMPVIGEIEQRNYVGGTNDRVNIYVRRSSSVGEGTISSFTATAYDDFGNPIREVTGFFLEPRVDSTLAMTSGSDTAIEPGTYTLSKSTYKGNTGFYQVDNVPGRTNIKIHAGNYHGDTEGCFLPGTSHGIDSSGNAAVWRSNDKREELTSLLDEHGGGGIIFNVS